MQTIEGKVLVTYLPHSSFLRRSIQGGLNLLTGHLERGDLLLGPEGDVDAVGKGSCAKWSTGTGDECVAAGVSVTEVLLL